MPIKALDGLAAARKLRWMPTGFDKVESPLQICGGLRR
jgi:hypothetical protein